MDVFDTIEADFEVNYYLLCQHEECLAGLKVELQDMSRSIMLLEHDADLLEWKFKATEDMFRLSLTI